MHSPRLADTIATLGARPGVKDEDFLLGGSAGEVTEKETVEAVQLAELRMIKQKAEEAERMMKQHTEEEEERKHDIEKGKLQAVNDIEKGKLQAVKEEEKEELKRKLFIRVRDQVATAIQEDEGIVCFSFSEANPRDVKFTANSAEGFSFNKEQRTYFKRVKYSGDLTHAVLYESVVNMASVPIRTPSGTPSSSPEKQFPSPGSGKGSMTKPDVLGPNTKYEIRGHAIPTWCEHGDQPSDQASKLVR